MLTASLPLTLHGKQAPDILGEGAEGGDGRRKSSLAEAKQVLQNTSREQWPTHCQGQVETECQESWRGTRVHGALWDSQEGPGDQATALQESVEM